MHDQRAAAVELHEDVLAAAAEPSSRETNVSVASCSGGTGRDQRPSSTSNRSIRRPSTSASNCRTTVSTSGSSGMPKFYFMPPVYSLARGWAEK